MKQLFFKLSWLLFLLISFTTAQGQGSIYIHQLNGINEKFLVKDIDRLTFPGENMLVAFKSMSLKNYPIPDIRFCNFKSTSPWDTIDPRYVIRVFPNPTDNKFRIKSSITINELILYDVIGQKLMQMNPGSDIIELQLNDFARGIYLLQMMTYKGVFSEKIIKH